MKNFGKWLLLLLALALTAGGALLPYAVSYAQDRHVEAQSEARSFEPVRLTLLEDNSVMTLLEKLPECLGTSWDGETHLTVKPGVITAARDTVSAMTGAGLIQAYAQKYPLNRELLEGMDLDRLYDLCDAFPMLMVGDGDFSAVVWVCYWHMGFEGVFVFDDASGKLISASVNFDERSSFNFAQAGMVDSELFTMLAYEWRDFFAAYYGIGDISVTVNQQTDGFVPEFLLQFKPGNGQPGFQVPLVFYGSGWVAFNCN
ncbi:MAG: hypothetical protein K2O18_17305 [Oscillospiraceae bacterium]|nr:hypothetical protein [Oscillospiraceae bacterium]